MKKKSPFIAGVLCMVLIISMVLSAAFMMKYARHDCTGDGCEICHQIVLCEQLFEKEATDATAYGSTAVLVYFFVFVLLPYVFYPFHETPVRRKVKLSC